MTPVCVAAETVALLAYLAAAVLYPQRLIRPDSRLTRHAHWGLVIGASLQGLGLLAHLGHAGSEALFGQYANASFVFVLLCVGGLLWLEARTERPALGAFLAPVIFLVVLLTLFEAHTQAPVIRNPWFVAHIVLTLLAYACFGAAFCLAAAYLVHDGYLKRKRVERLALLPPLRVADRACHTAVAIGLPLFTLGLAVGAAFLVSVRAPIDAKVVLALVTWLLYAAYLALRLGRGWRGRRLHWILVVAFLVVLLNLVAARHRLELPPPAVAVVSR